MNINKMIELATNAKLSKFQLTEMIYKPILKELGYPIGDTSKMIKNYHLNRKIDISADYAYIGNKDAVIVVMLEEKIGENKLKTMIEKTKNKAIPEYAFILNGIEGNLYYKYEESKEFHLVQTIDLTENLDKVNNKLSPNHILTRDKSYWEDIINKELYKEIAKNKTKHKERIIRDFDSVLPGRVNNKNIDDILKVLLGTSEPSKQDTVEKDKIHSKLLSEIEYDTDFRSTTIESLLIDEEIYPSMNYTELFRILISYMEGFVNKDNIGTINKAGLFKGTTQMTDRVSELSPSYRNDNIVLGNTYIALAAQRTNLINTAKRLFGVLGIDQSNVLIQWVEEDEKSNKHKTTPSKPIIDRGDSTSPKTYMLSEIKDTDNFTSTSIKKVTLFGKETNNVSYRGLLRDVISTINSSLEYKYIDEVLTKEKIKRVQVVPNYYELTEANKKRHTKLGTHYVGLNYNTKDTLAAIIHLRELFDLDQDEIILYLEE